MPITDTHTHLYSEAFDQDRETVVQRAIDLGVERFFVPAIDSSYHQAMFDLEQMYPKNVFLMMGLHPGSINGEFRNELDLVVSQLEKRRYYAIGEIGIDLYWEQKWLDQQKQAFAEQIRLAKQYSLPIVIHCRDAFDEVFEVLEKEWFEGLRGIFHCFTGTREHANRAMGLGLKLGIGGVVTFKNGKIDTFLDQIDLGHLVLETDSPYLAPTPFRGKRNESSYILKVIEKLADIYKCDASKIIEATTQNSKEVFKV